MGEYNLGSAYNFKPHRDHRDDPPVSVYIVAGSTDKLDKFSCNWCKRTIFDVKGNIDKIVTTPLPIEDFDVAINILCKQCHAQYRLLVIPK